MLFSAGAAGCRGAERLNRAHPALRPDASMTPTAFQSLTTKNVM